jgi:S-(hydroxymethyl)glutathione dehydrogenase/alcohol dehydrogenase
MPACGTCSNCLKGEPYLCLTYVIQSFIEHRFLVGGEPTFGLMGCGTFAEEIVVPRPGAVKIDADVPFDLAALIGCGVMTGAGSAINTAGVRPGDSVLVIGCGGVGIAGIQGARIAGAAVIAALDTAPAKLEVARRFGATHVATPDGLTALVGEATGGEGFDYALDMVASPQTILDAWGAIRRGGAVVVAGAGSAEQKVELSPFDLVFLGKRIVPCLYGSANPAVDYGRLIALWRAGQLDLAGMVTQRIALEDLNDALAALGSPDVVRQVVIFP